MSQQAGEFLVELARKTFVTFLTEIERAPLPFGVPAKLREKQGVFVRVARSSDFSWTKDMEILACMGYPFPSRELVLATIDSAVGCAVRVAASNAFKVGRLDHLLFEVSVLTKPELLNVEVATEYPKRIEMGKDGLIAQHGLASGLILPQVSIEKGFDEKDLLSECCFKAGLPFDAWLTLRDIDIYKFQAEVFRETGTDGKVVSSIPMPQDLARQTGDGC